MNFQAGLSSSDKQQRILTLSKHLQFLQAIQQVRQIGKSFHRGNTLAVSKVLKNSMGHHQLKAAFRRPLCELGSLAGGHAKGALVTDLLRPTANTVPYHKRPIMEQKLCSNTAQSKVLLHLGSPLQ